MDSPGEDPRSVTGQIASGANLVAFTTGRGSVSGYKPGPCIKPATNSEMHARMAEDRDIKCGEIVADGVSVEQKGRAIFALLLRVASGEATTSEEPGFGGAEFVPWQIGTVLEAGGGGGRRPAPRSDRVHRAAAPGCAVRRPRRTRNGSGRG